MHEHDDDDALWTGQGGDAELEGIERTLGVLRWQPRALDVGGAAGEARVIETVAKVSGRRRGWAPVVAAVIAAAAVFVLIMWLRPGGRVEPAPVEVQPVAPPSLERRERSPDLKDPFARAGADDLGEEEERAPREPGVPEVSPDLKDPFAGIPREEPRRRERKPDASADLKDPFKRSRDDDRSNPYEDLSNPYDPAPQRKPSNAGASNPYDSSADDSSPDLKDPFRRD